ncbi:hypothetical protein MAPG_11370 [Magnaporthiopsis poae ATCC 64411]|uniref:Uncharacterized protein n=1 Tax=Magnaporthiopsis poae (strain ATCC 64411 / 73-15) TaxID=644358 RepID=A0A0C4EF35_MAGP6|nr:hypothetical protein MAPG_11370 [Magnaporthiopsis poae ATCC 64411]
MGPDNVDKAVLSEMTLAASLEWSLLQRVGAHLRPRRSQARLRQSHHDGNLTFIEPDLRELLFYEKLVTEILPRATFAELQLYLEPLCSQLDQCVNPSLLSQNGAGDDTASTSAATYTEGVRGISATHYSRLRSLSSFSRTAEIWNWDLISTPGTGGTNSAIFLISPGAAAEDMLNAVKSCILLLRKLLENGLNGHSSPVTPTHHTAATATGSLYRARAHEILDVLFEQYTKMEPAHEHSVLLSVPVTSIVDMLLPKCFGPNKWQRTQCLSYEGDFSQHYGVDRWIEDICTEVQAEQTGSTLTVFLKDGRLFGARPHHGVSSTSRFDEKSLRSFHHLINTHAFRVPDLSSLQIPVVFSREQKAALALNLAHCLTEFFDSKSAWPLCDSKRIFVIYPPNERKYRGGPLYFTFSAGEISPDDMPLPESGMHPVIMAFAKLLLEIDNGKPIDLDQDSELHDQWAELCVQTKLAQDNGKGIYCKAVRNTLFFKSDKRPGEDPRTAIRRAMREDIITALEEVAKPPNLAGGKRRRSESEPSVNEHGGGNYPTVTRNQALSSTRLVKDNCSTPGREDGLPRWSKRQRMVTPPRAEVPRASGLDTEYPNLSSMLPNRPIEAVVGTQLEPAFHGGKQPTTAQWVNNLKKINIQVEQDRREHFPMTDQRILVAILDTGYDPDLIDRENVLRERDFVTESNIVGDSYGHGTYMARLVIACAPFAKLAIARVAENTSTLESSQDRIAKAILWAGCECQADIISMSFGFPSDSEAVSKAIGAVKDQRGGGVVFLASAGNSSMEEEAFPARHPSVISIQATDRNGCFLPSNARSSNGNHGPAALGTFGDVPSTLEFEGICNKYPKICQPGSSVATAVAAAISATLLAYANILPSLRSPNAVAELPFCRLRESQGMEALFRDSAMAQETSHRRWFVNPIRFWTENPGHEARYCSLYSLLDKFNRKVPRTTTHEKQGGICHGASQTAVRRDAQKE